MPFYLLFCSTNYSCCHRRLDVIQSAADDGLDSSKFDRIKGEESWVGCKIKKKFCVGKGKAKRYKFFEGKITAYDDDEENSGHRIFQVTYEDGDEEWLSVDSIHDLLTSSKSTVHLCKDSM